VESGLRQYRVVTGGYWAFTLTDGAIRMLVVLYFHSLGYSPFEVAMLFLFYEFFGVVTNLVGGWLGSRIGLNLTMHIGMGLQVVALAMLMVPEAWLTVPYVMTAQALSGIAKDLNKMSAKASVKTLLPDSGSESRLFKWVAVLTGSKNALKGVGFFLGAALLQLAGFRGALAVLSSALLLVLIVTAVLLPSGLGKAKSKPKFTQVFSKAPAINWLAAARFFLFGSRDVWFVVGLPVFLYSVLGWSFTQVGRLHRAVGDRLRHRPGQRTPPDPPQSPRPGTRWRNGTAVGIYTGALPGSDRAGPAARPRPGAGAGHRPGAVRGGICHQLGRAFLPDPGLFRLRQGVDECRLLLHGQCRRASRRDGALRLGLPDPGADGLSVVVDGLRAGRCGTVIQAAAGGTGSCPGADVPYLRRSDQGSAASAAIPITGYSRECFMPSCRSP